MKRMIKPTATIGSNNWLKELLKFQNDTKHHYPQNYAPSKGYLDWTNQPCPFRTFIGEDASPKIELFLSGKMMMTKQQSSNNSHNDDELNDFKDFYLEQEVNDQDGDHGDGRGVMMKHCHELNEKTLSQFMFYASSISATKKYGHSKWSLRVNPSSGNLHPCEVYLILNSRMELELSSDKKHHGYGLNGDQKDTFVYSYQPEDHSLQLRCEFEKFRFLVENETNRYFFICINTVNYRETWKYGIRSYRYSQLDTGHLINCFKMSSNLLGWDCFMLNEHPSISNPLMEYVLGLDQFKELDPKEYGREFEKFETILIIDTKPNVHIRDQNLIVDDVVQFYGQDRNEQLSKDLLDGKLTRKRYGTPNLLTTEHQEWPQMEPIPVLCEQKQPELSQTCKNVLETVFKLAQPVKFIEQPTSNLLAHEIIRTRRSAQNFDGKTEMQNVNDFYAMLEKLLPSKYPSMWRCLSPFDNQFTSMGRNVNLIIFVHRINGLESGMYFLYRGADQDELNSLKSNSNVDFEWAQVVEHIPLYRLFGGDLKKFAKQSSCMQDIASDSCFSVSMVTGRFLQMEHAHCFKQLYQEAGFIGQILYLEAERLNLRGTGIGCFFDDAILSNLLQKDLPVDSSDMNDNVSNYQDLYHFTIGKAVEDRRIQNVLPYPSHRLE